MTGTGRNDELARSANPILDSPYEVPSRHFELGSTGPAARIHDGRRDALPFLPLPRSKKARQQQAEQGNLFEEPEKVVLTIFGTTVDQKYTDLLLERTDLDFEEVLALDRIQKRQPISDAMVLRLRRKKLVEGRRPNLHIAARVAEASAESRADYIRTRAQDDEFYSKLVFDYLREYGETSRKRAQRASLGQAQRCP